MQINHSEEIKHHKLTIKSLRETYETLITAENMLNRVIFLYEKEDSKYYIKKYKACKASILSLMTPIAKDINSRRLTIEALQEESELKTDYLDLTDINLDDEDE